MASRERIGRDGRILRHSGDARRECPAHGLVVRAENVAGRLQRITRGLRLGGLLFTVGCRSYLRERVGGLVKLLLGLGLGSESIV